MAPEKAIVELSDSLARYSALLDRYQIDGFNRNIDPRDNENAFDSDWAVQHYFSTGADALRIIIKNLITVGLEPPRRILDFPCGSGRVMRHLRALFQEATIGACDLSWEHVEFCSKEFDAEPIMSSEDLSALDIGQWDLIFCGSLLTHLPEPLFWPTMDFMIRSLNPNGLAVVTLEGRRSIFLQDNRYKLIGDEQFEFIRESYQKNGFGYSNYHQQFRDEKFNAQDSYGVTIVRPDWLMAGLAKRDNVTIQSFTEADWDEHQDVIVLQKRPVSFE